MHLRIQIACPAPAGSTQGNRVTARRWARLLRELGHRASVVDSDAHGAGACRPDVLVALHARKSAAAAAAFRARRAAGALVVVLTGTDVYGDLAAGGRRARAALRTLELADRVVALQPAALAALPPRLRRRARVVLQSADVASAPPRRLRRLRRAAGAPFEALVLAHLRREKDPLRAALAARLAPPDARLAVRLAGRSLDPRLAERARREERRNARFRWLGELPHRSALGRLARSDVLVVSSLQEGGANAVGEACRLGVPVLATRIPGNVGLLGPRHPGLFPPGDERALAELLQRAERAPAFLGELRRSSRALAPRFAPARERAALRALLDELLSGR